MCSLPGPHPLDASSTCPSGRQPKMSPNIVPYGDRGQITPGKNHCVRGRRMPSSVAASPTALPSCFSPKTMGLLPDPKVMGLTLHPKEDPVLPRRGRTHVIILKGQDLRVNHSDGNYSELMGLPEDFHSPIPRCCCAHRAEFGPPPPRRQGACYCVGSDVPMPTTPPLTGYCVTAAAVGLAD